MGDFYGTGIEIWAGNKIWADYEQLLRPVFSCFHGKKEKKEIKNIVASALKSCIK